MLFIFLHIVTMFTAVALSLGVQLIVYRVATTGNVAAIRTAFGVAQPIGRAAPMVYGVGFLFGLIAAITGSFNLLAPWLLISYVLFVISSVISVRSVGGWMAQVGRAAALNQGDAPSTELQGLLHDKRATQGMIANLVVVAVIIALMVFKPFGT